MRSTDDNGFMIAMCEAATRDVNESAAGVAGFGDMGQQGVDADRLALLRDDLVQLELQLHFHADGHWQGSAVKIRGDL